MGILTKSYKTVRLIYHNYKEMASNTVENLGSNDQEEYEGSDREFPRRDFLRICGLGSGAALALSSAGCDTGLFRKSYKELSLENNEKFREAIEKEKMLLIEEIKRGIREAKLIDRWMTKANEILKEMRGLDEDSEEFKELDSKRNDLIRRVKAGTHYKFGDQSWTILDEANPYAESLLENEKVLEKIAFLKYASKDRNFKFEYIHNNCPPYHDLENVDVYQRVDDLINTLDRNTLRLLKQEDLFYFLLDENFDPNLDTEKTANLLNSRCPSWKSHPAVNHDYHHNNNIEAFNVFELNRIKGLIDKMQNPDFVEGVFRTRDEDIKDYVSESGGHLPILSYEVQKLEPVERKTNRSRVFSVQDALFKLNSLASFHFHATDMDTSDYMGPSGGDDGKTFPGVVFTSLSENEIAVHFYISRKRDFSRDYDRMDVISLGTIKREGAK